MTYADWKRTYEQGGAMEGPEMSASRAAYYAGYDESKGLLLSFVASLTLADNLGDVGDDIQTVLKRADIKNDWDDLTDLSRILFRMGVKTLHGTDLTPDDEGEE